MPSSGPCARSALSRSVRTSAASLSTTLASRTTCPNANVAVCLPRRGHARGSPNTGGLSLRENGFWLYDLRHVAEFVAAATRNGTRELAEALAAGGTISIECTCLSWFRAAHGEDCSFVGVDGREVACCVEAGGGSVDGWEAALPLGATLWGVVAERGVHCGCLGRSLGTQLGQAGLWCDFIFKDEQPPPRSAAATSIRAGTSAPLASSVAAQGRWSARYKFQASTFRVVAPWRVAFRTAMSLGPATADEGALGPAPGGIVKGRPFGGWVEVRAPSGALRYLPVRGPATAHGPRADEGDGARGGAGRDGAISGKKTGPWARRAAATRRTRRRRGELSSWRGGPGLRAT